MVFVLTVPLDSPGLPQPDSDGQRHSERLALLLKNRILAAGKWISFAEFMQCALYEPGLGYYSAGSAKLGAGGDFTTAPETSSLFGLCLASQVHDVFESENIHQVLELGAGSGRLAADLLLTLKDRGRLPERYWILELSGDLRERQRLHLQTVVPELMDRIHWLDQLPAAPQPMVVIANEVADALPVERFVLDDDGVLQNCGVTWKDGFCDAMRPASGSLLTEVRKIREAVGQEWPHGYCSEICLGLRPWLTTVLESIEKGCMFVMDYGYVEREYYLPERSMGTLMCHYQHRAHADPYFWVGLQDITAWVNFSELARVAVDAGCQVLGFTNQSHFLLSSGASQLEAKLQSAGDHERMQLVQEVKALTMPDQMGERFKVMAIGRHCTATPTGFHLRDFRGSL